MYVDIGIHMDVLLLTRGSSGEKVRFLHRTTTRTSEDQLV